MNGIVVTAYNSNEGTVATTTTATINNILGQYTFTIPDGTGPVRVQFSNFGATSTIPQLVGFQPSKRIGGTTIAFVTGTRLQYELIWALSVRANTARIIPLWRPVAMCEVIRAIPPHMSSYAFPIRVVARRQPILQHPWRAAPQVGATWGLAYRRSSDDLFAAAYTKQFVGYKPGGSTGAIYVIHGANSSYPTVDPNTIYRPQHPFQCQDDCRSKFSYQKQQLCA